MDNDDAPSTPATLSALPSGETAHIADFLNRDAMLMRFREMGLIPGTKVTVVRRAPLGDPIEISVRGSLLSIRGHEADQISVTREQGQPGSSA